MRCSDIDILIVEGDILFVPKVSFRVSSIIINSYFKIYSKIVELCELSLPNYGMLFVFEDKSVTFRIKPDTKQAEAGYADFQQMYN